MGEVAEGWKQARVLLLRMSARCPRIFRIRLGFLEGDPPLLIVPALCTEVHAHLLAFDVSMLRMSRDPNAYDAAGLVLIIRGSRFRQKLNEMALRAP